MLCMLTECVDTYHPTYKEAITVLLNKTTTRRCTTLVLIPVSVYFKVNNVFLLAQQLFILIFPCPFIFHKVSLLTLMFHDISSAYRASGGNYL